MQTDLKKHETHTDASNVLGCVFVINFDEAIIFKTDKDLRFYDTHYNNFDKAKNDLISYYDTLVNDAKRKLSAVRKMKIADVKSFIDTP